MNTSRDAPAKVVEATVTRDEVEARFKQLAQVADAVEAASHLSTLDLEPNPKACSAYGGCPHAQRCNLTNEQKLKGLFNMAESLTDRMNKIKANKKAEGDNPPATVQPITRTADSVRDVGVAIYAGVNPPATVQPINPPASEVPAIGKGLDDRTLKAKAKKAAGGADQEAIEVLTDAVIKELFKRLGNLVAKV